MRVLELLAQAGGAGTVPDPSLWEQFGPFAIVFLLMSGAIGWLLKERAQMKLDHTTALAKLETDHAAEVTGYRAQIEARDHATAELYDRIIEGAERQAPLLERCARALERVAGGL